ncbi:hypothetical protein [Lysinibacillus sp. NPDC056232]|uniref:hypothetical protein n=1 Tax=Lysinibacillus sp. NPDC056232 TaxID=3345756 RepID=UPI0035E02A64
MLKITEQQIKAEVKDFTQSMMNIFQKTQPTAKMLDIGINEINGVQIGYLIS